MHMLKTFVRAFHSVSVRSRRDSVLAAHVRSLLPSGVLLRGLDVGCGSGSLSAELMRQDGRVTMQGTDISVRDQVAIEFTPYDGTALPWPDASFDFVLLVDVLHHSDDALTILKECQRVSRSCVVLKDHYCENRWDYLRLCFMDWFGNYGSPVELPHTYLSGERWQILFREAGLRIERIIPRLGLYSFPANLCFDGRLHFMCRLEPQP